MVDIVNHPPHYTSHKFCGCCKKLQSIELFAKNKIKADGLQERCTPCRAEHHQKTKHLRSKPSKEQKRKYLLKAKYALSPVDFDIMLEKQNHSCAICRTTNWGHVSPSVDHCHTTGKVRGLLCNDCNRGLGLFKDNKEFLENAAKYIS